MGLFKDFKDDFSQAVNELVPGGDVAMEDMSAENVDILKDDMDVQSELSKFDNLRVEDTSTANAASPVLTASHVQAPTMREEVRTVMNTRMENATDATSIITAGTTITGDLVSDGNFEIDGVINGSVKALGKVIVTGAINGNTESVELFADSSRIAGEIKCTGTVKIGAGSVIVGNITATSAVIAGAVKGDIDVQGPVVVDTSAVVMGNIKSRSVQINNGAVIDGYCSQAYADINMNDLFSI